MTPAVYSAVHWIGPREKRVPDRECNQGYKGTTATPVPHHRQRLPATVVYTRL